MVASIEHAHFIKQLKPLLMKAFKYVPITTDRDYASEEIELKDVKYHYSSYNVRGESPEKIEFTFVKGDGRPFKKYTNGGDPSWFNLVSIARELVGNRDLKLPDEPTNTIYLQKDIIIDKKWGGCDITGRAINWWDRRHDGFFPLRTSEDKNTYWVCAPAVRFFENLQASIKKEKRAVTRAKLLPMGVQSLKL
jgi:hypothetical protein